MAEKAKKVAVKKAVVKKATVKKIAPKKVVKTVVTKKIEAKKAPVIKSTGGVKVEVYDVKGKVVENMNLPKEIFGVDINNPLMAQAVRVYLQNQRRGTSRTKSRGEVSISTRKIYRQKGTGRARHGAASAPIFVGGGIAHGPKPRDFSLSLPKKMRKAALFSALSSKIKDGEIKALSGLEKIEPRTKKMAEVIKAMKLTGKILLVIPDSKQENVVRAGRNIQDVRVMSANLINTYEVLNNKQIIFMKDSIESLRTTYFKESK